MQGSGLAAPQSVEQTSSTSGGSASSGNCRRARTTAVTALSKRRHPSAILQMLVEPLRPVAAQPAVEVLGEIREHLAAVQAGGDLFSSLRAPAAGGARGGRAAAGEPGAGGCGRRHRQGR